MSSVTRVPQTRTMDHRDLSADDARTTLRHYGRLTLVKNAFVRFRYGDGFTSSRALALQLVLALVPLGIAFVGLASTLRAEQTGKVLREVLLRITPGSTDEIVRQTLREGQQQTGNGELALWIGLAVALAALTVSMGQVERGANRIYGIQRDRPALRKYSRAVGLACSAGLLSIVGFLVVVAGGTVGTVLAQYVRLERSAGSCLGGAALPGRHPAGAGGLHAAHREGPAPTPARLVVDRDRRRSGTDPVGAADVPALGVRRRRAGRSDPRTDR